ncbi:MAG: PSD1 domain-containing protein [Planctomycetes bacterium]|nr:PSD1 domain-containing protein [Planctomycetota bacterium]
MTARTRKRPQTGGLHRRGSLRDPTPHLSINHHQPRRFPFSITRLAWSLTVFLLCLPALAHAEPGEYERDIKPLLKARCYACHGALKQAGNLRLDTGSSLRSGGDSGPAVEPGNAETSLLLRRVSASQPSERMPPEGEPLSAAQIELLRGWILAGATSPAAETAEADPRAHWAFQPPRRPVVPMPEGRNQGANPIDAFLDTELARHSLAPRPAAPKQVQLRRVYLDLIGLPPTREELREFLADDAPDAYERVVNRLLSDARHGERWARHWMDVWRYSDWYGRRDVNDVRNSASQIYRWRDWIVRSLNQGKGYDRMLQEMLAADEMFPEDYDAAVATGYLIRNYYSLNPNDWMRSAVEHTGKAFLGLTVNCAHCHDHKYDPIEQVDYFRMRAFFEPVFIRQDRVPGEPDPGTFQDYTYAGLRNVQRLGTVRVYDRQLDAPTWFYTGGDERNRVKERGSIAPGVPAILLPATLQLEPVTLPPLAWYPGLRPEIQETLRADSRRALAAAEEALRNTPPATVVPSAELQQAEAAHAQALEQAKAAGRPTALAGEQSLLLDATQGRAIVQNSLKSLTALADGVTISFELLILNDKHVNFQLVKENRQGLTADYFGWVEGSIQATRENPATPVEVGKYNIAAGQNRFQVELLLRPTTDEALLTVRSVNDGALLVDKVSTKMNGWTPIGNEVQTISFDVRPGSVAVIDDVRVSAPVTQGEPATRLFDCGFEAPRYADGSTPAGLEGWLPSTFSENGGVAVVSSTAGNKELRESSEKLRLARRNASGPVLRRQAVEARSAAASAELAALEARIAAERARYLESTAPPELVALILAASRAERQARVLRAESDLLGSDVALLDAELKPASDAKRAAELEAARKAWGTARQAVETARTALADEKLAESYAPLSVQYPRQSSGRRRALANWLTQRDHPLTARVAVNHIWLRHFRSPLVASVYDFGRNGAKPTHPELLDWLAVEFMESGWDMQHLHRLIVTSAAYRRLSSMGEARDAVAVDPENKFLWRMNAWRMESEVVRDSLLAVAGRLDLTQGGAELENKDALTTHRRSLYYSSHPEAGGKSPLGELFDAPDPLDCYRRATSIVPQQALALTNSDMVRQSSVALVQAWQASTGTAADASPDASDRFIDDLFAQVLSRSPSGEERRICRETLDRQLQLATEPQSPAAITQARESLARILLNHNDFVTVR